MRWIVLVALCSCVPTSYTWSPSINGVASRPSGCPFAILSAQPDEPFDELGTMKHYNGDVPKTEAAFRTAISAQVCDAGGHAVIATPTPKGYETTTVIRYSRGYHP